MFHVTIDEMYKQNKQKNTIVAFMWYATNNYYALPTYVYLLRRHCGNTNEV